MNYTLVEKQVIYDGKKVRLEVHHLDSQEDGKRHKQEIVVHNGAVVILAFVDAETILLIRNRRYAISQYLLELPAGTIDKGEMPMNTAGRELKEETGYLAGRIQLIGGFFSSPGVMTEKIHAFAAYDLEQSTNALEEGEDIQLMPTKLNEAIDMIRDGQISDGKTIATLLMYDKFNRKQQG